MVRSRVVNLLCLGACLFVGGCERKDVKGKGHLLADAQQNVGGEVVTTTDSVRLPILVPSDPTQDYMVLLGAYGPNFGGTESAATATGIVQAFDPSANQVASFELQSGWAYVVRPPRFPIIRTPRKRGGVRASSTCDSVQVIAFADANCERIIFLGAYTRGALDAATKLEVDCTDLMTGAVTTVELMPNEYSEITFSPGTLKWNPMVKGAKPITDGGCPAEVRNLVKHVRTRAANRGVTWSSNANIP